MVYRSLNSSRAVWRDCPHWPSVEHFVEQVRRLDLLLMLLFGSVVTGEFTQYGDVYERWWLERTSPGWRWAAG
jgi:hypothetical protein